MIDIEAAANNTILRGFVVDGNRDNNGTGAYHAISVAAEFCLLEDLEILDINANGGGGDGVYIDSTADDLVMNDMRISECERREITIVAGGILLGDEVNTKFGTVAAVTDDERAVFVCHAPNGCLIIDCLLTSASDIAASAVNFNDFTLYEKGTAGTDNDVISTFDNDSAGDNVAFSAFVALSMNDEDPLDATTRILTDGVVASLDKTDTAAGLDTDELLVTTTYVTF